MGFYIRAVGVLLIAVFAFRKIRSILEWRRFKEWGRTVHGCGEPVVVPNKLPGGIERPLSLLTNIKSEFIFIGLVCYLKTSLSLSPRHKQEVPLLTPQRP
jgi:hypothetical protein